MLCQSQYLDVCLRRVVGHVLILSTHNTISMFAPLITKWSQCPLTRPKDMSLWLVSLLMVVKVEGLKSISYKTGQQKLEQPFLKIAISDLSEDSHTFGTANS